MKAETETDICTPMFIAELLTTAKRWKQPKCLSTTTWTRKRWSVYRVEYYLAMKREDIFMQATTWMNCEDIL